MIYTVANREETEKKLEEKAASNERVFKQGLSAIGRNRSPGGAVWRTIEDVKAWLAQRRAKIQDEINRKPGEWPGKADLEELDKLGIFGVEADWDRDCVERDEPFRRLIISRPIVKLEAQ